MLSRRSLAISESAAVTCAASSSVPRQFSRRCVASGSAECERPTNCSIAPSCTYFFVFGCSTKSCPP
eukprot:536325-Prorocentrum_minimum.AAC.8